MSKRRPYLVADEAQVVVMRSLASTAFGAYNLDLPDGLELSDVWEGAAPGNTPGYVASLDRKKRVGGMFRRFMRADVHITVPGDNPEVRAAASDVEQVLDEARDRTSGEFFLESDITGAGLGPWVPLQDFVVGDTVDVAVFGAVVPMKVTRIEPTIDEAGHGSWLVHVGGQLVSDDVARVAENEQVHRALVDSRRELAGLEASARGASRAAARAQVAADSAQSAADGAQSTADSAQSTAVAVGREARELREGQDKLKNRADLLSPLLDYCSMSTPPGKGDALKGTGRVPFSYQIGPRRGATPVDGMIRLDDKGLWDLRAMVTASWVAVGGEIRAYLRVLEPDGKTIFSEQGCHSDTLRSQTMTLVSSVVIPEPGYYVDVWVTASLGRGWWTGPQWTRLSVQHISRSVEGGTGGEESSEG